MRRGPGQPLAGLARLMTRAFQGADLAPLAAELIERASTDPDDADALMDLSIVLQLQGIRDLGVTTQAHALATRRLYELGGDDAPALRLLAIMAPGDLMTNTPLEFLIEHSDISLTMLYLMPGEPLPREWPAHDVAFTAVSQSQATEALLERLSGAACALPPSIGPASSRNTSRTRAWRLLHGVPGVAIPMTAHASRAELKQLAAGALPIEGVLADGCFPLIVRPVDSHAGRSLAKVDSAAEIDPYLCATEGDAFFISRFIDYRDDDGLFRKYRIVFIDGVAHAGHMGISSHWMIHYLNAGMADSAAKRAEEEAFMRDFDAASHAGTRMPAAHHGALRSRLPGDRLRRDPQRRAAGVRGLHRRRRARDGPGRRLSVQARAHGQDLRRLSLDARAPCDRQRLDAPIFERSGHRIAPSRSCRRRLTIPQLTHAAVVVRRPGDALPRRPRGNRLGERKAQG